MSTTESHSKARVDEKRERRYPNDDAREGNRWQYVVREAGIAAWHRLRDDQEFVLA